MPALSATEHSIGIRSRPPGTQVHPADRGSSPLRYTPVIDRVPAFLLPGRSTRCPLPAPERRHLPPARPATPPPGLTRRELADWWYELTCEQAAARASVLR